MTLKVYMMDPKHSMAEHLRVMSDMIRNLKSTDNNLSVDQQILDVIQSPLDSCKALNLALMLNKTLKCLMISCVILGQSWNAVGKNCNEVLVAH